MPFMIRFWDWKYTRDWAASERSEDMFPTEL